MKSTASRSSGSFARTAPASVAESLLAAIDAREYEVVFDAYTASVKQRLAGRIEQMYPELR
jgi:hypothetical protein